MVQLLLCIFNVKLWRQDPTSIRLRWPNGRTSVATSSWLFLAYACLKCARAGGSVAPATTVATTSSQPQTWCRWMVATEFFEDFSRGVAQPPAIGIDHPPQWEQQKSLNLKEFGFPVVTISRCFWMNWSARIGGR